MCKDIILLIVGAAIGFVSSIGIIIVEQLINRKGRLMIFYKFIHAPNSQRSWGIIKTDNNHLLLDIPTVFEFQNTSNTTRVIRNLNVELYNGNNSITNLDQIESIKHSTSHYHNGSLECKSETFDYGSNNGSYSYVLPPRSIQKQKCDFSIEIHNSKKDELYFDTIKISYYNERNHKKSFTAKTGLNGWTIGQKESDTEWQMLK